jgi:hypothetical protein
MTTPISTATPVTTITPAMRDQVATVISAGLVKGLGEARPGALCLEAAICLALGEPHGDKPSCVAAPDRAFAIRLQDAYPGTPAERAALFLPLGLAQLGTAGTDRAPWLRRVIEGTIRKVLPVCLRTAAEKQPAGASTHKEALLATALRCETEGTQEAADAADAAAAARAAALRRRLRRLRRRLRRLRRRLRRLRRRLRRLRRRPSSAGDRDQRGGGARGLCGGGSLMITPAVLSVLCCGGTRSRAGCEYHDPALQAGAAAAPARAPRRATYDHDTTAVSFGGVVVPPMASPYAGHRTGQHGTCPCRACTNLRLASAPVRARAAALPAGARLLGPDDPEVLGPNTPPDLIYAVPGGGVMGVPQTAPAAAQAWTFEQNCEWLKLLYLDEEVSP